MGIRRVKGDSQVEVKFRVFCDGCKKPSNCTHEDPGDLAIAAKKERFITVPGVEITDPMDWLCKSCNEQTVVAS